MAVGAVACASIDRIETAEAQPLTVSERSAVAPAAYRVAPANAQIAFVAGPGPTGDIPGSFNAFTGSLDVQNAASGEAVLVAELDVASASLANPLYRGIMLGDGWFEAETYPTARFEGRLAGWQPDGHGLIVGTMTIRDISHPEEVAVFLTCAGVANCPSEQVGYRADATLNRTDYGMTQMSGVIGNEVRLQISGTLSRDDLVAAGATSLPN